MEKYLKINNDPYIEGDFVETTDTNSPFVVADFKVQGGDYWSNPFTLDFRYKTFNDDVRELCNSNYINISNADIIPLEEATGAIVRQRGLILFLKHKEIYKWTKLFNIYLELIGPNEVGQQNNKINTIISNAENDINRVVDLNTNLDDATSDTTNIISWEFDVSSTNKQKNENKSYTINIETSEIINLDSVQYLISGHDGETFFFEGSPTNKTGASFKLEYDSKTMNGEFSLIVDFNNLKAINAGFRRCVIKMVNNEASIKEASSFIMIEKGQAHYSEQDKVWMVDKPLVIKLLK